MQCAILVGALRPRAVLATRRVLRHPFGAHADRRPWLQPVAISASYTPPAVAYTPGNTRLGCIAVTPDRTPDLNYFVSYAHADQAQTRRLLDLLAPRLAIARGFRFSHWIDDRIGVGERWTDEIRKPLVPVMLKPIPMDGAADLAGLEQLQILRNREGRSFSQTRGPTADAFAEQLVSAILAKLNGSI